jgi:hypothetical protein
MRNNLFFQKFQNFAVWSSAAMFLFLASTLSASAQRTSYPIDRRVDQINRQNQDFEREKMKREMKGGVKNPEEAKRTQAIKTQIREDLEAIQTAYNEIVTHLQTDKEPDQNFTIKEAAKVKKLADRLKANMMLPEPETETNAEEKPETTKKMLRELCRHIYQFVTNPIFETQTGLKVEPAIQAHIDLKKIILLSEMLEKGIAPLKQ